MISACRPGAAATKLPEAARLRMTPTAGSRRLMAWPVADTAEGCLPGKGGWLVPTRVSVRSVLTDGEARTDRHQGLPHESRSGNLDRVERRPKVQPGVELAGCGPGRSRECGHAGGGTRGGRLPLAAALAGNGRATVSSVARLIAQPESSVRRRMAALFAGGQLASHPAMHGVIVTTRTVNLLAAVWLKDLDHLYRFITVDLGSAGVASIETILIGENVKRPVASW